MSYGLLRSNLSWYEAAKQMSPPYNKQLMFSPGYVPPCISEFLTFPVKTLEHTGEITAKAVYVCLKPKKFSTHTHHVY